ncbi:hypothetical protein [Pseudogracilibacillus sp. SO30301A]|uniref:hypothetical protein n=1 Tax=Pseudogracilibacillus sp. SO30301A TaxID=3098291 RepID=UPI00300E2EE3
MELLIVFLIIISVLSIFTVVVLFRPSKSHDMNYKEGLFYPFFFALVAYVTLAIAFFLNEMF